MTNTEKVLQAVDDLPDDAPIEEAMERLFFMAKIEKGLQQADAGQTISHDEAATHPEGQERPYYRAGFCNGEELFWRLETTLSESLINCFGQ